MWKPDQLIFTNDGLHVSVSNYYTLNLFVSLFYLFYFLLQLDFVSGKVHTFTVQSSAPLTTYCGPLLDGKQLFTNEL